MKFQAVKKEDVFSAAEDIMRQGKIPTIEEVRQRIGGSYSYIGPFLKEWRELQKVKPTGGRLFGTDAEKLFLGFVQDVLEMARDAIIESLKKEDQGEAFIRHLLDSQGAGEASSIPKYYKEEIERQRQEIEELKKHIEAMNKKEDASNE